MFENSEIDHLLNFVGYGDKNADTWFLGMEEGGGGTGGGGTYMDYSVSPPTLKKHGQEE